MKKKRTDFGCLMFTLNYSKWARLLSQIDTKDLYIEGDYDGFEVYPHVTLLYGFHLEQDKQPIISFAEGIKPQSFKLTGISLFETDSFDVLKFDVELTPELKKYYEEALKFENTQTFDKYTPHATIAYLKKGKGKKYITKNINKVVESNEMVLSWNKDEKVTVGLN